MTRIPGPAALTLPGIVTDLPLDSGPVSAAIHYRLTEYGQIPETAILLGETLEHGVVRVGSGDAAYFRRIEAAAQRCAHFLEAGQQAQHGTAA